METDEGLTNSPPRILYPRYNARQLGNFSVLSEILSTADVIVSKLFYAVDVAFNIKSVDDNLFLHGKAGLDLEVFYHDNQFFSVRQSISQLEKYKLEILVNPDPSKVTFTVTFNPISSHPFIRYEFTVPSTIIPDISVSLFLSMVSSNITTAEKYTVDENKPLVPIPIGPTGHIGTKQTNSELPRIIISRIDTDDRGENLGKVLFSIIDTIPYGDNTICDDVIEIDSTEIFPGIFETKFIAYPQIQFVVKGQHVCGSCNTQTLAQKVEYLIDKYHLDVDYLAFFQNLSFYAVARYIISGFLYHKFSVKFLLEKYYKQFLIDLGFSHFQRFLEFFNTEPYSTYYKYFLFDLKGSELKCVENIICKDLQKKAKKKCEKVGCIGNNKCHHDK
jgi:hypothetical protein